MAGSRSVPSVLGSGASPTASAPSVPLLCVHSAPRITAEAPRRRLRAAVPVPGCSLTRSLRRVRPTRAWDFGACISNRALFCRP